jgi:hypothetical protein
MNLNEALKNCVPVRGARPIWVRAPKGGQTEHFTGLSRGKMYALEAAGLVKTASLKPPGAVRGVKLFSLKSLLGYVQSCTNQHKATKRRALRSHRAHDTKEQTREEVE